MIQLIHYHLSAHIFQMKKEQDEVAAGTTMLRYVMKADKNLVNP